MVSDGPIRFAKNWFLEHAILMRSAAVNSRSLTSTDTRILVLPWWQHPLLTLDWMEQTPQRSSLRWWNAVFGLERAKSHGQMWFCQRRWVLQWSWFFSTSYCRNWLLRLGIGNFWSIPFETKCREKIHVVNFFWFFTIARTALAWASTLQSMVLGSI